MFNDNITRDFIFQEGVHLNKDSTCIIAGNVVDFVHATNNFFNKQILRSSGQTAES